MNILPDNAHEITNDFLESLGGNEKDGTVYISDKKPSVEDEHIDEKVENPAKEEESEENQLDFQIYDSDEEESGENIQQLQTHLDAHKKSSKLENNDTHITTATSSDDNTSPNITINQTTKHDVVEEVKFNALKVSNAMKKDEIIVRDDEDTKESTKSSSKGTKSDVGSRTMEQWLNRDNLIVHPVWIGNLPRGTTVNQLRHFVETQVGKVLVSIHISVKQQNKLNNERTYAFLNLPTAEKQLLAVTLLDGKIFTGEKLIVRPKRPSKFPQSFFGSSPISEHFKHFRDCVVPAILANPTINLNVTSVRRILEQNHINIDHLPNRVWCVQCTLVPQCHRTYCSFYHCHQEKELGRIISILAAQICGGAGDHTALGEDDAFASEHRKNLELANDPNAIRSRHTLLIQGLPRSITSKKIEETFEVFGEIDNVIVNPDHTCYVRMKRSQDARKIVHLFKYNHAGVIVDFAPYGVIGVGGRLKGSTQHQRSDKLPSNKPNLSNYATEPNHRYSKIMPNLVNNRSHDGRMSSNMNGATHTNTVPSLPITNPKHAQRPVLGNSQTINSMNYGYNNMAAYGGGTGGYAHNNMNGMRNAKNISAKAQLRLNKADSQPIPTEFQHSTQNAMYNNMSGRYMNNTAQFGGNMNTMMHMTPQQYAEYYQQMQQYYRSNNQFNTNNNANYGNFNPQYSNNTQYRFPQWNASANASGYNQHMANMQSNAFSQNYALSPIAQTPNNMNMNMNNMNHMNMNMNGIASPLVTSPPVTSPRVISPTAYASTNTLPRNHRIPLRSAYSDNNAYNATHSMTKSHIANPSYDDNMITPKYYYQPPNPNPNPNPNPQNTYNDGFITRHKMQNNQHQKWMTQMQQQQAQSGSTVQTQTQAQPHPHPQPQPPPQTQTHTQFQFKAKKQIVTDDGSIPGAPKVAANSVPEPDLHFQLSAHDFPLSPTSALKTPNNKQ